jgi:hypothetical protein
VNKKEKERVLGGKEKKKTQKREERTEEDGIRDENR